MIAIKGLAHVGLRISRFVDSIALQVADIDNAIQNITTLGISITEGPVTFGDGSTSIFIRDPDRNVLELAQPRQGGLSA